MGERQVGEKQVEIEIVIPREVKKVNNGET